MTIELNQITSSGEMAMWIGRLGVSVDLRFEPRHLWVGVFWDRRQTEQLSTDGVQVFVTNELHISVCLLPCLPIHVTHRVPAIRGISEG
jgi:hypothetical protein